MAGPLRARITNRLRSVPIRHKLVMIAMVATTSALVAAGIGILFFDSFLFREYLRRDLSALARIIGDNSTAALAFEDSKTAGETLAALRARSHVATACIYRQNGTLLAQYLRADEKTGCASRVSPGDAVTTIEDDTRSSQGGLTVSHPILLAGRRIGTLILFYDLGELYERIKLYSVMVFAVLLIASLISFVLSKALRSLIAEPISNLVETASAVARTKDYSIRAPKLTNDELGVLVDAFNEMLSGIQSTDVNLQGALAAHEAALRDAQDTRDSLETTLASIGDAVISTDVEGRIVLVNRAAQALLRWPEAEIIGKPLDDIFRIVNEFSREKVDSPVTKVLREGTVVGLANHTVLIAKDGMETPIDDSGAPIRDRSGKIHGTVLVFRDVTGKRRADETSQLLAAIVQSSDDAIIGHALDGVITSWNKGAERTFGYSAEEMIGQPSAVLAPPGQDEMPAVLERIRNGERIEQYLTLRRTHAGNRINVSITVSPLYDAIGRTIGASKIARDVTEQVRATERLAELYADLKQSNERLARSNEDLERFAFVASHDFQEPLRTITVYSQLLVKSYGGQLDGKAATFVDNIVTGTERMRNLLADLLAYAEAGVRQEDATQAINLDSILEKVRQNLAASISDSGAVITTDRLPTLKAYEGHFIPLFQNLIGNAIKYRSDESPRIYISVREAGGVLEFTVSDNGIGIAPEFHQKVFVPFKRLHGKQIPGTGIGLAICQRVVERYGGRIWVESQEGNGSTFFFTLPDALRMKEETLGGSRS